MSRLYEQFKDRRFWCEVCGQPHPLYEHRQCRDRAASQADEPVPAALAVCPPPDARRVRACHCGQADVRLFPGGWRCEGHAPAGVGAGRYCAPLRCYCGECVPLPVEREAPRAVVVRVPGSVLAVPALSELDLSDERLGEPEWLVLRVLGGVVLPGGPCGYPGCKAEGALDRGGMWCRKHARKMERRRDG